MLSDYRKVVDEIYQITLSLKLCFNCSIMIKTENNNISSYNEYKTSINNNGSVMIKRKMNYFLSLESKNNGYVLIYPELVSEVISKLKFIKYKWLDEENNYETYSKVNNGSSTILTALNTYIIVKCPLDRAIRFSPGIETRNNIMRPALDLMISGDDTIIQIPKERVNGWLHLIENLDMATYANTTFSMVNLIQTPTNRTDFTNNRSESTSMEERTKIESSQGRTIKKKNFFD